MWERLSGLDYAAMGAIFSFVCLFLENIPQKL
jgi:hypothetical protein